MMLFIATPDRLEVPEATKKPPLSGAGDGSGVRLLDASTDWSGVGSSIEPQGFPRSAFWGCASGA